MLVLIIPVDPTLSISILPGRLLLVGGIIAATLIAWTVQYTFHVRMTRSALFPWGAAGGAGAVLLVAAQTNSLGDHHAFVVMAIVRSVLLCLTIRWAIHLVFGPIGGPVAWQSTTSESPIPHPTTFDELPASPPETVRPARMKGIEHAVTRDHAELKLVSESDDSKHNVAVPARHKRTSG